MTYEKACYFSAFSGEEKGRCQLSARGSDNAGSLAHYAIRELPSFIFLYNPIIKRSYYPPFEINVNTWTLSNLPKTIQLKKEPGSSHCGSVGYESD